MTRRIRDSLDLKSAELFCEAVICSRIDYCIGLLNSAIQFEQLHKVLNLVARIVARRNRFENISPSLSQLGRRRTSSRHKLRIMVMIYKALKGWIPIYFSEPLKIYIPPRELRSSNSTDVLLVLGAANSRYGQATWSTKAPALWNSLPGELRGHSLKFGEFYDRVFQWLSITLDAQNR